MCMRIRMHARPRVHYRLLTLCPAPTDPVGQSWPRVSYRTHTHTSKQAQTRACQQAAGGARLAPGTLHCRCCTSPSEWHRGVPGGGGGDLHTAEEALEREDNRHLVPGLVPRGRRGVDGPPKCRQVVQRLSPPVCMCMRVYACVCVCMRACLLSARPRRGGCACMQRKRAQERRKQERRKQEQRTQARRQPSPACGLRLPPCQPCDKPCDKAGPSPTLSPTGPVPRGQLWPTGSVGAGHRVSRR